MVMSDTMIAVAVSCGVTATAFYLWGRSIKGRADYFNSITLVIDLKWLDDLVKEKTTNLLVVVSGIVASAAPFNCKYKGPLGVVLEHKSKLEDGGLVKESINILLQRKETPWYLENSTGRVNVVGAQDANGFFEIEREYVAPEPLSKIFNSIFSPEEGSKVLMGHALSVGTSLTCVGEAVRDKTGNLIIQKPKEHPFMVFREEGFDKMVDDMKSNSEFYIFFSEIFGTIAVAIAVKYGVDFIRKFLLPFVWKKKDLGNNNAQSDDEETDINDFL